MSRPGRAAAALTALLLAAGPLTGCSLVEEFQGRPLCPGSTPTWIAVFLHSRSDRAEEPQEVEDLTSTVVPAAASACARLQVVAVGANGLTAGREIATVDFDTDDVDGRNPEKRAQLVADRREAFVADLAAGLRAVPYAPASDPFGGYAVAATLLAGATGPKRLTVYGDQLANRPIGCVLTVRDLARVDDVLAACSPAVPPLQGVDVEVVGAGYSLDAPVSTATAQGLETLLRTFFTRAGARVVAYVPLPRRATGKDS